MAGGYSEMIFKVLPNPNHSRVLRFSLFIFKNKILPLLSLPSLLSSYSGNHPQVFKLLHLNGKDLLRKGLFPALWKTVMVQWGSRKAGEDLSCSLTES